MECQPTLTASSGAEPVGVLNLLEPVGVSPLPNFEPVRTGGGVPLLPDFDPVRTGGGFDPVRTGGGFDPVRTGGGVPVCYIGDTPVPVCYIGDTPSPLISLDFSPLALWALLGVEVAARRC